MRNPLFTLLQKIYYGIGGHGLGRIKPLRWAYHFLFGLLKPGSVMVQGHRIWLDDKDTLELATHEVYEPVETGLFKSKIQAGDTVLDIGANIGYYTLMAARRVGPQGKVYAFEPDPANFRLLEKNVKANGYGNVILVNKAVADKNGKIRLYLNPSNRGDHRVYDSKDGRSSIEIEKIALDRFFKPLDKKIHFIKMDIQGAEALALEGMKGLVRANKGLKLITEFSPASLEMAGSRPQSYLKSLQTLGFRFFEISEKKKSVQPVKPAQVLKRSWGGSEDYTNLLCVKD
ncbi:MAG TPA: FkbM family methyltransferase [bacterium]|jgi:FkbM family methyltransferase|nr:FkbM family methyltransferase [bacterium]